ncbi:enoyl-CoA delta isomerase 2 [Diorhabda carinulata]|uniref:enoyl-CoA delta isomerase 2 n=1 Tax=Diorhabda carinulata TaxID=1163345 RepID=UPI0025A010EA|nr:enoyl-CoA delta isomerase 2 [Diorhabda carinulata]
MVIIETFKNGVKTIKVNRPWKKNAFNMEVYKTLTTILNKDANNDKIAVTLLTAVGDYFSSGNDMSTSMQDPDIAMKAVEDMVEAFINYPKLLICIVNGTAIGIGATLVTLCDIVYASDRAVFDTPFLKLGLCVEGTSSFSYPFILGRSVASEVLFLNRKLTAQEACNYGLVSRVIPHSELDEFIKDLHKYGTLSVDNIKRNKAAIMENFKKIYSDCNKREFEVLKECINSEDFSIAVQKFLMRKSKL